MSPYVTLCHHPQRPSRPIKSHKAHPLLYLCQPSHLQNISTALLASLLHLRRYGTPYLFSLCLDHCCPLRSPRSRTPIPGISTGPPRTLLCFLSQYSQVYSIVNTKQNKDLASVSKSAQISSLPSVICTSNFTYWLRRLQSNLLLYYSYIYFCCLNTASCTNLCWASAVARSATRKQNIQRTDRFRAG